MTATTFLTGKEALRPSEPPLVAGPRLSLADGLRLLRTPSSEQGVQAYHRALEGGAAEPHVLLDELEALRLGRSTRFELLALIATSPKAAARGVSGPGLFVLRAVRKAFVATGAADRIRRSRALASAGQDAALSHAPGAVTPADVARKIVALEGAVMKLQNRIFERSRETAEFGAVEARLSAIEAELKARLRD